MNEEVKITLSFHVKRDVIKKILLIAAEKVNSEQVEDILSRSELSYDLDDVNESKETMDGIAEMKSGFTILAVADAIKKMKP